MSAEMTFAKALARAVEEAVAEERRRCVAIVLGEGTRDAFGKLDWPYLRKKIVKAIEKGA